MPFRDVPARVALARAQIAGAVSRGGHGQEVRIVAVTKTQPASAVDAVVAAGLTDVGENKVQEALNKMSDVSAQVNWHLIGHLQRNKVKHLPGFSLFHALDSDRLAAAVSDLGRERNARVSVLVQVNCSGEGSKGGFAYENFEQAAGALVELSGLDVRGVMTMAPLDAGERELRRVFARARAARDVLRSAGFAADELSMGMSNDFGIAVEEGATMVRLGTILFGERQA